MSHKITIHDELKELSPAVAGIPHVNVFSVPDGYFDRLTPRILLHIEQEQLDLRVKPMDVPEGYFDGLADNIMSRIRSEEQLVESTAPAFLQPARHINVYTVPGGYFDTLGTEIMNKINRSANQQNGEGEESMLLNGIKHINVFDVPAGYFESFPDLIMQNLPVRAKVISMNRRPAFYLYAVAAVLTGILGFSLMTFLDNKSGNSFSSSANLVAINEANRILKNGDFEKEMDAISDDAIVSYLKENGQDVSAALVASVTDENTLPAEDEYIIDEKTLDNFLNEYHISQHSSNSN